ncbi:hypothetical protein LEP1GSC017_1945 [Leptospira meyeri serovar Hardjo str. Went 5]|nr:hypothetical protein LEP1GSC017_1945 [Leptospira meyeri serovar Hardjo str. Went 5]
MFGFISRVLYSFFEIFYISSNLTLRFKTIVFGKYPFLHLWGVEILALQQLILRF